MKGLVILANGFEDIEAVGTIALLRRGGINLDLCTIEEGKPTGKYGVTIDGVQHISQITPSHCGLLVLPGGPGYKRLLADRFVKDIATDFHQAKKYLTAICAAPTIYGHWGILKDRQYACFPGMQEERFEGYYSNEKVVIDEHIITGKSAGAVTDFALAILSVVMGQTVAEEVRADIYF